MKWMDQRVSLYKTHADNIGRAATLRDILLCDFAQNIQTIVSLRELDREEPGYDFLSKSLKAKLQCFTPAALLASKARGELTEISRSGILQLDFDYKDILDYDIEELKQCVFSLPFIGFCGLSCTGKGFYALAVIEEPLRLSEYAHHCFNVLRDYGITVDTSKGPKPENLRYVSYDCRMLIRDNPEPLKIKLFRTSKKVSVPSQSFQPVHGRSITIQNFLKKLQEASVGSRWQTVQRISYFLGGLQDPSILDNIKQVIQSSSQYAGLEDKYCKCAHDCFMDGSMKPLNPEPRMKQIFS